MFIEKQNIQKLKGKKIKKNNKFTPQIPKVWLLYILINPYLS